MNLVYLALLSIVFYALVVLALNFLPVATTLPDGVSEAIILVFGYLQLFNFLFPVDTLIQVLLAAIVFQAAIYAWFAVRWLLALISTWFSL